jgi:hypothetical protein
LAIVPVGEVDSPHYTLIITRLVGKREKSWLYHLKIVLAVRPEAGRTAPG